MRLGLKIAMVIAMTIAILVPLLLVQGVIHERQSRRAEAVASIARNVGGAQTFAGPVLVVPYTEFVEEEVTDNSGNTTKIRKRKEASWTFFPTTLDIRGPLRPDIRRRGLHEVRVYSWQGNVRAHFDAEIPADADPSAQRTIGAPWLSYEIADVRGLRDTPRLSVDGNAMPMEQGAGHRDAPGLHVRLAAPKAGSRWSLQTAMQLTLGGTETFSLVPLGKQNDLRVESSWPHPKFDGISPQQDIDASGFRAHWQLASLATNAQRRFLEAPLRSGLNIFSDDSGEIDAASTDAPDRVSVSLIDPVNTYLQAERATKYGVLFVLLTFVGFFMFELIKRLPIHPIQYGLVGLALVIFFLLLVSLGEHLAFGWSYLVAAGACIGLIGFYLAGVLRSVLRGAGFAAMLATLYATLYGLLLSEDNALVLGAGLLFLILAAIMVLTRKVDWYRLPPARPDTAGR